MEILVDPDQMALSADLDLHCFLKRIYLGLARHWLPLCLPVSSSHNLCKQMGPRSGPTNHRT